MSAEFRTEIVINTNRSLQHEKSFLEQELRELRRKRSGLENTLNALKIKLLQTKEVNRKMNAALQLAEYKVRESETRLRSLQNYMEKCSGTVQTLKSSINKLKEEEAKHIEDFKEKIGRLAERYIEARESYDDCRLAQRLEETLLEIANMKQFSVDFSAQREDLIVSLENLKLDKAKIDGLAEQKALPAEQQKYIMAMMTEEIKYLNGVTQNLLNEHQKLKEELDNI